MGRAERFLDRERAEARRAVELSTERLLAAVDISDDLAGLVRDRPIVSLGVAAAVGFAAGAVALRSGRALTHGVRIAMPYLMPLVSRLAPQLGALVSSVAGIAGIVGGRGPSTD